MTEKYRIKEGDSVTVEFNNSQVTLTPMAEVLALPSGPGDSWVFRDLATNTIYYVSEGCTIIKVK